MRRSHLPDESRRPSHAIRARFNVINEALIRESLERLHRRTEDLEERRPADRGSEGLDDIDIEAVERLQFSFRNLYRISSLDGFTNLRVLLLDNNSISMIENLGELVQLRRLDLSFNKIEQIPPTAFDGLVNLENLSLFANQLTTVEHLQGDPDAPSPNLPSLISLNIGRNLLEQAEDVNRLRKFKRLRSLVMCDNPIFHSRSYKSTILEYLPGLTFLDHRLVSQEDIDRARDHSDNYNRLEEAELVEQQKLRSQAVEEEERAALESANIPGVRELYVSLFEEDDLTELDYFTQAVKDEYEEVFSGIIRNFITEMKDRQQAKKAELEELRSVIEAEKRKNMVLSRDLIKRFERFKKREYRRLGVVPRFSHEEEEAAAPSQLFDSSSGQSSALGLGGGGASDVELNMRRVSAVSRRDGIARFERLERHAKKLVDRLIEIEVNQSEAFVDVAESFVEEYQALDCTELIGTVFKNLMGEDKKYALAFSHVIKEDLLPWRDRMDQIKESERRGKMNDVKHLLEDKDQIESVMRRAAETRQELISGQEEVYQDLERKSLDRVVQMVRREEHERNRMRIYEIWSYYDRMAGVAKAGQREAGEIQEMRAKFESRFE